VTRFPRMSGTGTGSPNLGKGGAEKSLKSNVNKAAVLAAVAVKHPGVFMETSELEAETGQKIDLNRDAAALVKEATADMKDDIKTESPEDENATVAAVVVSSGGKRRGGKRAKAKTLPAADLSTTATETGRCRKVNVEDSAKEEEDNENAADKTGLSSADDEKKDESETGSERREIQTLKREGDCVEDTMQEGNEVEVAKAASTDSDPEGAADGGCVTGNIDDSDEARMSNTPRRRSKRREQLKIMKEEAEKAAAERAAERAAVRAAAASRRSAAAAAIDERSDLEDENEGMHDGGGGGGDEDAMMELGGGESGNRVGGSSGEASHSVDGEAAMDSGASCGAGGGGDRDSVCSEQDSLESGSVSSGRRTTRPSAAGGAKGSSALSSSAAAGGGGKKGSKKGKKGGGSVVSAASNAPSPSPAAVGSAAAAAGAFRGKSRRAIFKRSATKAPSAVARATTSDRVFYKGQYYSRGDIVSVVDVDDGGVYYAQLKGFLTDQYCEKSGVITWLLPSVHSPPPAEGFDPATYVIGPEEELPRKLDHLAFVMHAPDDYFHYKRAPYPTATVVTDQEYVLTRMGPKVRLLKSAGHNFKSNSSSSMASTQAAF